MNTIGIIANRDRDTTLKYTKILIQSVLARNGTVRITSEIANELGMDKGLPDEEAVVENCEMVICLGGDGTFLKAARKAYKRNLPILGINLGNLGFLTEVDKNQIDKAVERVLNGDFSIEERMMLDSRILRGNQEIARDLALNDVVISRGAISRILHLSTYINDVFVDSFPGDGIIVSTPTGSTAYSLAAGGPVVDPDINIIIITPICPHIMYSKSYITTARRVVKVVVKEEPGHNAMVTVDGQEGYEVRGGDSIEIKKSSHFVRMVRLDSKNFFKILKTKIYDRGENLRQDEI